MQVYFPEEHIAKYVPELRVAENVVYRDRHAVDVNELVFSSLNFTRNVEYSGTDATSTGKRTLRDETRYEKERMEREAAKQGLKRTRTGLREYHERRRPRYLS